MALELGNLQIAEFYSAAEDCWNETFFGGIQDVGVLEQDMTGQPQWTSPPSGDGGIVAVDDTAPLVSAHYLWGDSISSTGPTFLKRVYNSAGVNTSSTSPALNVVGGGGNRSEPLAGTICPSSLSFLSTRRATLLRRIASSSERTSCTNHLMTAPGHLAGWPASGWRWAANPVRKGTDFCAGIRRVPQRYRRT